MTARPCSNPKCHVDDGETCFLGELSHEDCATWKAGGNAESSNPTAQINHEARVPWSGSALGTDDLMLLLPRAKRVLIGVLGAHDVGKTTLLTANYLLLLRGHKIAGATFSGSRTLDAWEALASWMRFHDSATSPMFPPHTPRASGRVPGLLHVALRDDDGDFRDVLLADAPGEWFTKWAINESSPQAEGARWLSAHSDGFLIVADCQRLSGEQRGIARADLLQLIDRLGNHANGRPVMLVWTKSEFKVPEGIRASIQQALADLIPGTRECFVSITAPTTLAEPVDQIVFRSWQPRLMSPIVPVSEVNDTFLAFRGHHAQA